MSNKIIIRKYKQQDAKALVAIFYNTIHIVNIRDYSSAQVKAWAPESKLELDGWIKKWQKLPPYVALIDDVHVGFTEFNVDKGYIDCFYVHHDYQGKGVGYALMKAVFKNAELQNVKRIWSEVSITAKPFFERQGFKVIKEQTVTIHDVDLQNFVMEKIL